MVEQITFIATTLSVYGIAMTGILILRSKLTTQQITTLSLFLWSIISYFLMDIAILSQTFFEFLLLGSFLVPFSFWKLSRTIFSDEEQSIKRIGIETIIVLAVYSGLRATRHYESILPYALLTMKLVSIAFLILSVVESQRGRKGDLVKSRLKLRKTFVYFVAIIGLITVLTETTIGKTELLTLQMIQRVSVVIFTSYFLIVNSAWQKHFLGNKIKVAKVIDQDLINRINELMFDRKFYQQEGLSIGQLATKLDQQEYKLRNIINQEMGYRNFPAFVNSFRIEEAKTLLLANERLTIQEVAFKAGFNSIGPFNRAFKTETGLTPKAFRDKKSSQS